MFQAPAMSKAFRLPMTKPQGRAAASMLLLTACVAVYLLYSPGSGADWTFDDARNLAGLAQVSDVDSAIAFVFGNELVGFPGRPLSMASFLLNLHDWPTNPTGFRSVNVLLHILNGILVALVALRTARFVPSLEPRAAGFAVTLAAIWLVHPLLASTSLMAVQRMTVLAATCTLLGLLAYLKGRARLFANPRSAYAWMSGGLLFGSMIGVLAKETAALLPLLAGALELTVLSTFSPVRQRLWTAWRTSFFGGAVVALLAYTAWSWQSIIGAGYAYRAFGLEQRLLSEAVILFAYLRQILLPNIATMGPLQDDTVRILGADALSIAAACTLLALMVVAWHSRRRAPAFSFAVLFFLAGHLLESTVFPLEIYFEHRNYLPSLGPLGALVGLAWASPRPWPRALAGVLVAVGGLLLWQVTTTWGSPPLAAALWAHNHPSSVRATQYLAATLVRGGDYKAAAAVVLRHHRSSPLQPSLAVQTLNTQCFVADPASYGRLITEITEQAPFMAFDAGAVTDLHNLISLYAADRCPVATQSEIEHLARALENHRLYRERPSTHYALLTALARLRGIAGDGEQTITLMKQALGVRPNIELVENIVGLLLQRHQFDQAAKVIEDAFQYVQESDPTARTWHSRLAGLRARLRQQERMGIGG